MVTIKLYQFGGCPFCAKVRNKLEEKGIEYEAIEVSHDHEETQRKDIIEKSGCETVPVILIDDLWMGESGDIVNYIEDNF